jgi:hypothetical protein
MKPKENKSKEVETKEKSEVTVGTDELKNYSGDFWSEELGVAYRLGIEGGRIKVLSILDASASPRVNTFSADALRAVGSDEFEVGKSGVTLHFRRDTKPSSAFTLDAGRTLGIIFQRQQISGTGTRPN